MVSTILMETANPAPDEESAGTGDAAILREAFDNWKDCEQWQGAQDNDSREDIKFANADPRNNWQWPEKLYAYRTQGENPLPCLTINNTRTHNDLIINSMMKNRFGITIRPVGGKSSYKSAQVMQSLIRRIEYISKASAQYRKVAEHQVDGGVGYIIIETDYVSERSFDQDIKLKATRDPTGVYLDPWIKEPDGSDARFGFVFERMSRKQFGRKYPKYKDRIGKSPIGVDFTQWINDNEIMVAKYYRKAEKKDTLIYFKNDEGEEIEKLASEIKEESGDEIYKKLREDIKNGVIDGKTRKVTNDEVKWFLIAGDVIVDRGDWAGKYIPICRSVGREMVIDGKLDRKGHTRPMIDAQRMLNYAASTDVQVNALQPKAPWLAAARATEGQEQWKTANVDTFAVLLYNDIDDEAPPELQKVDPPQRINPPPVNPAYQVAMQNAERQMMMVSGQFQAQMGENDTQSAASGKAIGERQQQGDTATYHFPEHQGDMLRFIGVQLLDLIPKIYDTKRTLHIMDETSEKMFVTIDPSMKDAVQEMKTQKEDEEAIKVAFNPQVGEYECVSDPGPDYATQRQEAWEAMSMILQQNMQLAGVIGDLLFKYGDFPGSDKIMERLQKEIKATKPYLFDEEMEPQLVAAQQQNQKLIALNSELMQKLALKEVALKGKDERRDVDAFKAETDRMKAMIEAMAKIVLTPADRARLEHEIGMQSRDHVFGMITQANEAEVAQQAQANSGAEQ